MTDQLLLSDILFSSANRTPHQVALSHRNQTATFAEMADRVTHLADVLAGRGVRRGHRVGWWGGVHIHASALYYALASLGGVFVPINPAFNPDEAKAVLDAADPELVVTDEEHAGDVVIESLLGERASGSVRREEVSEHDPDVIFFTSGTTGAPKGVVLSQRANWLRTASGIHTARVSMSMFPQFHWAGWSFLHSAWFRGSEYVLEDGGDTEALLAAIERRRVESFYAIPAVWRRILDGAYKDYDTSSLQQADTGTSSTPPDLLAEIAAAFPGTRTKIGYGATEAGGICTLAPEDLARKPNSVGLPAPGMQVRLVDEELWVRSPYAFLGYYNSPDLTAEVVVDGWYRTGDVVSRDEEGYITVLGRLKEQIRTGGEFVAPAEVDEVIRRHPAVADAAVAGVPTANWGEVVTAFVVLRPGHTLDLAVLRRHCEASLARFKVPRALHLVSEIPITASTGKVQRRSLVALAKGLEQAAEE
ncbi:MAG TPA: class I adenylate-forming enzyme family protein [Acidimicrobiales bacterium]|nr:class I adenylate-forming enzyme family protein [Acidimicrobiales bacterium]